MTAFKNFSLAKHFKTGVSKQKGIHLGKSFKKIGKGNMHMSKSNSSISPSVEEFDNMMSKVLGKNSKSMKKSMFKRKQID